jgi:hydrogenase expression/formation protein HypC
MCLAIPGKIIQKRRGHRGVVSFKGVKKEVSLELVPEAKVGDYVTVHTGFAIGILERAEAERTVKILNL